MRDKTFAYRVAVALFVLFISRSLSNGSTVHLFTVGIVTPVLETESDIIIFYVRNEFRKIDRQLYKLLDFEFTLKQKYVTHKL